MFCIIGTKRRLFALLGVRRAETYPLSTGQTGSLKQRRNLPPIFMLPLCVASMLFPQHSNKLAISHCGMKTLCFFLHFTAAESQIPFITMIAQL